MNHHHDDDELLTIGVATAATDEKLVGDADKMLECRSYQSRMHRPHHNIVVEMTMMTISCSFHSQLMVVKIIITKSMMVMVIAMVMTMMVVMMVMVVMVMVVGCAILHW